MCRKKIYLRVFVYIVLFYYINRVFTRINKKTNVNDMQTKRSVGKINEQVYLSEKKKLEID